MKGTLVLAVLGVKSSYVRATEEPLDGPADVPDTLQWWISPDQVWRIKTFALDHDIHVHSVGRLAFSEAIALARTNNKKHYGDVVRAEYVLEFSDCEERRTVTAILRGAGLPPHLEVASGRFAFWKPDEATYETQSRPA
jgi:hypothetical protein